jgi:hypothetical protein
MASRDDTLSDWEDIGDDNLSVVSFGSESEAPAAQGSPKLETSTKTPSTSLPTPGKKVVTRSRSKSPDPDDPHDIYNATVCHTKRKPISRAAVEEKTAAANNSRGAAEEKNTVKIEAAEILEDPFRDPPSYNISESRGNEAGDATDSINEIIDDGSRDVDPVFLSKTHQSLCDIIEDTVRIVRETPVLGQELTGPSINICGELRSQLSQILPILASYAKVSKDRTRHEIPIDASLHEWLSGVRVKVLGLLAETQRLGREPEPQKNRRNPKVPWYVDVYGQPSDLERIWDELAEYKNRMCEFLPILQA